MFFNYRCTFHKLSSFVTRVVHQSATRNWKCNRSFSIYRGYTNFYPSLRCSHLDLTKPFLGKPKKNVLLGRGFRTSRNCYALPPALVLLLRPVINVVSVLLGRGLRKWWQSLSPGKRKKIFENIKKQKYKFIGGAALFPLVCYGYYEMHLVEAPITERKRFIVFSKSELLRLADVQRDILLEENGQRLLPSSHYQYKRVARVATEIIKKNEGLLGVQDSPWVIILVDDPDQRNAFVLPNKCIFVFTGMLNVCSNDDQLACILAHEIAHVALSHMEENLSKTHLIQMMLFIPFLLIWSILPNESALFSHWVTHKVTDLMINLPFSRGIEAEADEVGLLMAAKACFDVRESIELWRKMDQLLAGNQDVEWLSTHPSFNTRKSLMEFHIPSALKVREYCKCPPLFGVRI